MSGGAQRPRSVPRNQRPPESTAGNDTCCNCEAEEDVYNAYGAASSPYRSTPISRNAGQFSPTVSPIQGRGQRLGYGGSRSPGGYFVPTTPQASLSGPNYYRTPTSDASSMSPTRSTFDEYSPSTDESSSAGFGIYGSPKASLSGPNYYRTPTSDASSRSPTKSPFDEYSQSTDDSYSGEYRRSGGSDSSRKKSDPYRKPPIQALFSSYNSSSDESGTCGLNDSFRESPPTFRLNRTDPNRRGSSSEFDFSSYMQSPSTTLSGKPQNESVLSWSVDSDGKPSVLVPSLDLSEDVKHVPGLTSDTYNKFIKQQDLSLIMFYNSSKNKTGSVEDWAKHNFIQTAQAIQGSDKAFAMVDCSKEKDLCDKQNVKTFPFLKMYSKGFLMNHIKDMANLENGGVMKYAEILDKMK